MDTNTILKSTDFVKVNWYTVSWKLFTLQRGYRQGCLLSPLLFTISIEPPAQFIREDTKIKGIIVNGDEHKISLYADDILLYLTEPASTIPHLKDINSKCGYYSG